MNEVLINQASTCFPRLDECLAIISSIKLSGINRYTKEILLNQVSLARRSQGEQALALLVKNHVLAVDDGLYTTTLSCQELEGLGYLLRGMLLHEEVEKKDEAEIVLTLPRSPNSLEAVIKQQGHQSVRIQHTEAIFEHLANQCNESLTVMTPFLDEEGALFLVDLFSRSGANIKKNLILRFLSFKSSDYLYPKGLLAVREKLVTMGVNIYDYAIERSEPLHALETFHSKTILSDANLAYIGSANFNKHSLDNSMELGVLLSGKSVHLLSLILKSVIEVSKRA